MKKLLLIYIFIALILTALLSVLSYGDGAGYVYMLWHGIQIQSNIWVLVFSGLIFSFGMHLFWIVFKRYLSKEQRKLQEIINFDALHPYEQLGMIWILEGEEEQQDFIQEIFNQSGLLKEITQARILFKQKHYQQALMILDSSPPATFELAEIQRIEIYLALHDEQQVSTHLEFLNEHQLSPWLSQISHAYMQRLTALWASFALQFPWRYLRVVTSPALGSEAMQAWLIQLLSQFEQASREDHIELEQKYIKDEEIIQSLAFETQVLWLKLLSRCAAMEIAHEKLALHLLELKFDQEVFYLWFQQQLMKPEPDYLLIENYILQLELRYPSMPVLSFAQWHILMATQRESEAEQLLLRYPENILMDYLRIKSTLSGREDLIKQLNLVFENDANFIKFRM